jgi:hypothetical protein
VKGRPAQSRSWRPCSRAADLLRQLTLPDPSSEAVAGTAWLALSAPANLTALPAASVPVAEPPTDCRSGCRSWAAISTTWGLGAFRSARGAVSAGTSACSRAARLGPIEVLTRPGAVPPPRLQATAEDPIGSRLIVFPGSAVSSPPGRDEDERCQNRDAEPDSEVRFDRHARCPERLRRQRHQACRVVDDGHHR